MFIRCLILSEAGTVCSLRYYHLGTRNWSGHGISLCFHPLPTTFPDSQAPPPQEGHCCALDGNDSLSSTPAPTCPLAGPPSPSQSSPPAVYLSVATSVTHAILLELNFTPTLSPRLSVSFKGSHVFPGVIYVLGTLMCQGMGGGLSLSCRSPRTCPWSLVHTGGQESFPCWKLCAVHCSVSCPHVGMQDPATASAL